MDEDYSIYHIPMNLIIDSDKSDRGKLYVGISSNHHNFLFKKEIINQQK